MSIPSNGKIVDEYDPEDPVDTATNFTYRFFLPNTMAYGNPNADSKNVQIEIKDVPAAYPIRITIHSK